MHFKILSLFEFDEYASNHPLRSYHQSSNYAIFMAEKGYDYDFVGLVTDSGNIKAASLILYKPIGKINKYGYAPKGFLIDYYDTKLVSTFLEEIKKYYKKKNISFIKINPEIAIGEINPKTKFTMYNNNITLIDSLEKIGLTKLNNNLKFESMLPRFNAIIPLKNYSFNKLAKQTRNKIRNNYRKGLSITKGSRDDIDILYEFIKNKKDKTLNYYKNYYNVFSKTNDCDVFLIKIDFQEALINAKDLYTQELENNNRLVEKVMINNSEDNLNKKMLSDRNLLNYKNDIIIATKYLNENRYKFIAGAITIKYQNRVSILISGFDPLFKHYNPNYFLHYKLLEFYKYDYDFLDLNGITGDFSKENPYYGLNEFKLSFNPKLYEYIGEFDYIINKNSYKLLDRNELLIKEFNRKQKI